MSVTRHQKKLSKNQEKQAARDIGGNLTPGSGSLAHSKGDVRLSGEYLIECKYTSADRYTLKLDELLKIRGEAFKRGELPLFQIEFKGNNKAKYVLVPTQRTFGSETIEVATNNASLILDSDVTFNRAFMSKDTTVFQIIEFTNVPILGTYKLAMYEWNAYVKEHINND